jgi:hypothetical protein
MAVGAEGRARQAVRGIGSVEGEVELDDIADALAVRIVAGLLGVEVEQEAAQAMRPQALG